MPRVVFLPAGQTVDVEAGATILEAARIAGVVIEAPCNGSGTCGKCKVRLEEASLGHVELYGRHKLSEDETRRGYVLACQSRIHGDVAVTIEGMTGSDGLKIVSDGVSRSFEIGPAISKRFSGAESLTYVTADGDVIGTESGDTTGDQFGVVVDIGTTTLVASLVDLRTGTELGSASSLNPQATHAQDVLSRIKFASSAEGLDFMYSELTAEVNAMLSQIATAANVDPSSIYEVVYSGNTCMLHLATATDPTSLGKSPYEPALYGGSCISARDLGLKVSDFGRVYLPPIIAAYVGADITSGILAAGLEKRSGNVLFVDIGTNGEVVLSKDGALTSTSTAAGPAFEGMNITFGMRAAPGAIEGFEITDDGFNINTIGDAAPEGICGSGLFDIVGELAVHGVIGRTGRFARADSASLPAFLRDRITHVNSKPVFKIANEVYISQDDIRQVQLAKGAIRAGIEVLLAHSNLSSADLDEVLIAGSFGYHLQEKSILSIGLLPRKVEGRISFLGNTSKSGGTIFLLDRSSRDSLADLTGTVSVVELSKYEGFDRVFASHLGF